MKGRRHEVGLPLAFPSPVFNLGEKIGGIWSGFDLDGATTMISLVHIYIHTCARDVFVG